MKEEVGNKKDDLRQRTKQFALRILRLYSALPQSTAAQILGKQLLRSGTSIGANYREAYRQRNQITNLIGDAVEAGRIKRKDSTAGNKFAEYIPYWV